MDVARRANCPNQRDRRRRFSGGETNLNYSWNSYEQAKALLVRIRAVQKELRLLKQQISVAISSAKSEFPSVRVSVGKSVGATLAAGAFGRLPKTHVARRGRRFGGNSGSTPTNWQTNENQNPKEPAEL